MEKGGADKSIQYLKGVGPHRAVLLERLGIRTVKDALYRLPARYADRRDIKKIARLEPGLLQTAQGKVLVSDVIKRSRLKIVEVVMSDGSGLLRLKWFNQPYLKQRFKIGQDVVVSGVLKRTNYGLEMENPEYEFVGGEEDPLIHTARITPVYGTTEGISAKQLRNIVHTALQNFDCTDPVPSDILNRLCLPPLSESLMKTHFPDADADIDALNNRRTAHQKRLAFDELFMLELGLAVLKKGKEIRRGTSFNPQGILLSKLVSSLPFSLTGAQKKAFGAILGDMKSPYPMQRLLQGDVGCGKTVVALMAMLSAIECGHQAALMAPTELLAEQHYANIKTMLDGLGVKTALLTGSLKERPTEGISSGEIDLIVGTHAVIQEGVKFKKLGLIVIDEQHRFGVVQRAKLREKGINPDILIMTATPIPRTLAMTLYGDLDYSVIGELPPGRTPVLTKVAGEKNKDIVYNAISSDVEAGGQVYVVYPVIEGSEKTDLRSAVLGEKAMREKFPGMSVSLVHGRLKQAEREAAMAAFKKGETDILVSTTVIEVGVDVPNASLMVVVHAERFGLSQLHQLRGRVGRGKRRSRCMLFAYHPMGEEARRRLAVMEATSDGFKVAEEDLLIRGPGEFLGTRQSGLPDLQAANIVRDAELLEAARGEAFRLIDEDPELKTSLTLREALEGFWKGKIELFKTG